MKCRWTQKTTGIWATECGGKMAWLMKKCPKCKSVVTTARVQNEKEI